MCGILCSIHQASRKKLSTINSKTDKWSLFKENVIKRGPDCTSTHSEVLSNIWSGDFVASVLWMQGSSLVSQPCIDDKGNILLWNGDIFSGPLATNDECDTLKVLNQLEFSNNIPETLNSIEGPYSFIYFQKDLNLLYFGRDPIGRHSLLIHICEEEDNPSLIICSVANKSVENIAELPAIGIFCMDLNNPTINLSCYPWHHLDDGFFVAINNLNSSIYIHINKPLLEVSEWSNKVPTEEDLSYLDNIPLKKHCNNQEIMKNLLENADVCQRVTRLLELLRKSVELRIRKKPEYCKNCIKLIINAANNDEEKLRINCDHAKVGILFSGGLDSTVLAAIANELVSRNESIDLINVAFEKTRNDKAEHSIKNSHNVINNQDVKFDVPDRKTGYQALQELQKNFPDRLWNFIEVNISRQELEQYCREQICHLIYPLQTILDESLGCAVWFASRGSGILSSTNKVYKSSCRILLLGMGADELFGGYTRHRTILRRSGWTALNEELNRELHRISARNLGRDDRVVSDHGRQSRLPYLDENVVKYVQALEPWKRCCPIEKMPPGLGDKLLLRLLAYKIGLKETASFPKRAFQFGSRIANGKENAADVSKWLK